MEQKFLAKLNECLQYIKLRIFEQFLKWFECKISNSATNLLQWFNVLHPQKDKVHWSTKMVNLWEKISWSIKFSKNWLKKKARLTPWTVEGAQNLLAQIGSHGVLWIQSTTNVWCTRCELKVLIASQPQLNWWRRPLKQMTSKKHISNDQWKHWHAHANIQVSSNSLPSTQKPWRHTHCGGMGELFEKC